jgi:hypothetical protein
MFLNVLNFLNGSSEHSFNVGLVGMAVNAVLTFVTSAAARLSRC